MLTGAGPPTQSGASTALPAGHAESHSSLAAQLPAAAYHEMEEAALAILQMINDTATAPAHALAGSPSTTATSRTPGSPAPSSMSSPPDAAAALTPAMDDLALSSSPAPENAPFDIVVEDVDGMAEMGAAALLAMNHYAPSDPSSSPPNADAAGALGPPPPPAKPSSSASPSFVAPRRRVKSLSAATASSTGPRTAAANLIMARRSSLHGLDPASAPAAATAAAAASASARPRPRPAHLPPPLTSSTSRKRRRSLSAAEHLIIGQLARSPLATSFLSAMAAGPAPSSSSSSSHLHPSSAAASTSSSETVGKRRRLTLTSRDLSSATEDVVDLQSAATALVSGGAMPRSPPLHSVSPAAGARPRSLHSIQEDMDEEGQIEGRDAAGRDDVDAAGTSGDGLAPMQL
ncbi:hypothetical protein GGF32_007038 [Allomyces javanicus]|nr:hypothetical protein GGF32_007038 [Allomyces javanicus]